MMEEFELACSSISSGLSECQGECWICLESGTGLVQPCACPRRAHPHCIARWQLQSAGKDEESTCRFCNTRLPDWRQALSPPDLPPATPVVSVHYGGTRYRIKVKPGPEGLAYFRKQLKKITGRDDAELMQITFQCKAPGTAEQVSLQGLSAFDAAMHCAAVSSSQRALRRKGRAPTSASAATNSNTIDNSTSNTQSDNNNNSTVGHSTATDAQMADAPLRTQPSDMPTHMSVHRPKASWIDALADRMEGWARRQDAEAAAFIDNLSHKITRVRASLTRAMSAA